MKKHLFLIAGALTLMLTTGTARANTLKIDFTGTVASFLFYDSPLLNLGDSVSGSVMFDYPSGANPLGTYTSPVGTTTVNNYDGGGGSSTVRSWIFRGSGPSGTFNGLFYTLDGMVVNLGISIFSPPPLSDVLALPISAVGVQLRTTQITTSGGLTVSSYSYASLNLRSATLSEVKSVPDATSTGALASGALALLAFVRRFVR